MILKEMVASEEFFPKAVDFPTKHHFLGGILTLGTCHKTLSGNPSDWVFGTLTDPPPPLSDLKHLSVCHV